MSEMELFDLYNPKQPEQKKSRLQHLADICAFQEKWLLDATHRLEEFDFPHVVAFFQIPQPLFVEDNIYKLPAQTHGVQIGFQFRPFFLDVANNGQLKIGAAQKGSHANATQVIAFVPLWEKGRTISPDTSAVLLEME